MTRLFATAFLIAFNSAAAADIAPFGLPTLIFPDIRTPPTVSTQGCATIAKPDKPCR